MLRPVMIIGLALCVSGCDDRVVQPSLEPLTAEQAADARSAASQVIGKNGRALFICGQAEGLGVFTLDWKSGFTPDGMKDGRLIFLIRDDGREDVYFRDALGKYLSSLEDGGEVRRVSPPNQQIESWIISYPSTGIVETHNITTAPKDGLVNLWTSNKPDSLIGASAKLFRSSCVKA
jgi:hypothetical protein